MFVLNIIIEALRSSLLAVFVALFSAILGTGCANLQSVAIQPGVRYEAWDQGQTRHNRYRGELGVIASFDGGHKLSVTSSYRGVDDGNGGGDSMIKMAWTIPVWRR